MNDRDVLNFMDGAPGITVLNGEISKNQPIRTTSPIMAIDMEANCTIKLPYRFKFGVFLSMG